MAEVQMTFSRLCDKRSKTISQPWGVLSARLGQPEVVQDKVKARMVSFCVLHAPVPEGVSPISEAAVESMAGMVLDLDGCTPEVVEGVAQALRGLQVAALMYPTFSWSHAHQCWRVLVPYARAIPVADHRAAWVGASTLLGLAVDGGANDRSGAKPAQRYFVCSRPDDGSERPDSRVFEGPLIDPAAFIAAGGAVTSTIAKPSSVGRYGGHQINNELIYGPAPDAELVALGCPAVRHFKNTGCAKKGERRLWLLMLAGLKHCAGGPDAAHTWGSKAASYTPRETTKTMDSLSGGPPTCESIGREFEGCKTCPHWKGGAA